MQENPRLNPVGRPPATNSVETRKRIIYAARDVFRTVGYAGATHMSIAASAELTRPAVNYHFASKRALFDLVVEANAELLSEALATASAEPTLKGRLRVFVTAMCVDPEVHAATAFLSTAAMERRRHPELLEGGGDVSTNLRAFLQTWIASAVETRELRADADVASVADTVYVVLTGMALYGDDGADDSRCQARIDTMMLLLTGDLFNGSVDIDGVSSRVA